MPEETVDRPLETCKGLRGVVTAFYREGEILQKMKDEEATVRAAGAQVAVDNQGFSQALERDAIICIIKDPRFRPPPEPTVILTDSKGNLLGVEVFPWTAKEYMERDDVVWLADGFVMFPGVQGEGKEAFVMPPVSFPELNESNGCKDVISCSPAPTTDLMMRTYMGLEDDPRLASVLVAFNRI